jgi:ATP-dependent Clp protease ATP-binding subunit ClpC
MKNNADTEAILSTARTTAIRLNHTYIGTEHVLYSFLSGSASETIRYLEKELGLNIEDTLEELGRYMAPPGDQAIENPTEIRITPRVKKVITFAGQRAAKLGSNEVRIEDLLWGLLAEKEGIAAIVLKNVGLTLSREDAEDQEEPKPDTTPAS